MIMENYSIRESFVGKDMSLSVYPKYSDLKGFVEQAGCFDSQIDFYTYRLIMLVGFLVINILEISVIITIFRIMKQVFGKRLKRL
ncbi:MAG: hypothetical protein F6K58_12865 [Symploca sp. SIO2E9]|nr:hypothetical protein [Symploca sp. SIO2E9]